MRDSECVAFLQWALPRLGMRWPGFRKVRKQVCKRIQHRLGELNLADLDAYRSWLATDRAEWLLLDEFCRITISRFYRDRGVWDLLRDEVLPELAVAASSRGESQVRCWSAACASGEEVYTLSIVWKLCVQPRFPGQHLMVIATDVDPQMIERAQGGCFSSSSLKEFPKEWISAAFLETDSLRCLKPAFRTGIDLQVQDIRRETPAGRFDLILCRNLAFTYFDEPLQRQVLQRLIEHLRTFGVLVTGKQEPLPADQGDLEMWKPRSGVYRKTENNPIRDHDNVSSIRSEDSSCADSASP